jgi:hypothetical protein
MPNTGTEDSEPIGRLDRLAEFENLEGSALDNIYDHPVAVDDWVAFPVRVLQSSPGPCKLGLSLSTDMIWKENDAGLYEDFFTRRCNAYGETEAASLRFRSLRCGLGIFPTGEAALRKLTDLAFLEKIHIMHTSPSFPVPALGGCPQALVYYEGDVERCRLAWITPPSFATFRWDLFGFWRASRTAPLLVSLPSHAIITGHQSRFSTLERSLTIAHSCGCTNELVDIPVKKV